MVRRWPAPVLFSAFMIAAVPAAFQPGVSAQATRGVDESYFVERVYPVLHAVQCERCHSDNGVASETRLAFPEPDAGHDQITAFGLSLMDLVDRQNPEQSLLLRKPTKRVKHTGGQRIKPDSDEEAVLRSWINYLAGLSDEQVRQARERIARSERRGLEALAVRRLTHSQYNHTVRDLLGDQIQPASGFPKEDFVNGFKNQVEAQGVSPLQAEAYSKAAERLARAAFRGGDQHGLIPRQPESPTDAAVPRRVRAAVRPQGVPPPPDGRRGRAAIPTCSSRRPAVRGTSTPGPRWSSRPCSSRRISCSASNGGGQPRRAVRGRQPALVFPLGHDAQRRTAAAAEEGELATAEQIEATARRMLDDPRARGAMEEFLAQWMRFDRVLEATRDRRRFREFNAEVAAAMVEETRRLFNHLVWDDQNFMEFFTADYTFVNPDLARLYGLPAPGEEFAKVEYPADSGRSGVLGHGSFLVLTSKPAETSPTARGLFVRNQFLGQEIPPPPAGREHRPAECHGRRAVDEPAAAGRPPEQRVVLGLPSPDRPHRAGFRAVQRDRRRSRRRWCSSSRGRGVMRHAGAGRRSRKLDVDPVRVHPGDRGLGVLDAQGAGTLARREQDLPEGHREAIVPVCVRSAGDRERPARHRRDCSRSSAIPASASAS